VLGLGHHNHLWRWKASGKHPVANDYIDVQNGTPLTDAVADWMTKGYVELQHKGLSTKAAYSWRFWLRAAKKGALICGLARDSSDHIGRPFPLLIAGEGPVKNWEERWALLPALLSKTWGRIERIAAKRYDDLRGLSDEIGQLGAPENDHDINETEGGERGDALSDDHLNTYRTDWQRTGRIVIALNNLQNGADPAETALQCHRHLWACCPEIPRAVFWGGTVQQAHLVVFRQPLAIDDFVALWSL